jgi:hypothetical protein
MTSWSYLETGSCLALFHCSDDQLIPTWKLAAAWLSSCALMASLSYMVAGSCLTPLVLRWSANSTWKLAAAWLSSCVLMASWTYLVAGSCLTLLCSDGQLILPGSWQLPDSPPVLWWTANLPGSWQLPDSHPVLWWPTYYTWKLAAASLSCALMASWSYLEAGSCLTLLLCSDG